jgi:hypothetical protein
MAPLVVGPPATDQPGRPVPGRHDNLVFNGLDAGGVAELERVCDALLTQIQPPAAPGRPQPPAATTVQGSCGGSW